MATFNLEHSTAIKYTIADFKNGEIYADNLTLTQAQDYKNDHQLATRSIRALAWQEVVLFVRPINDNEHWGEYAKTYAMINRERLIMNRYKEYIEKCEENIAECKDTIADCEAYLSELDYIDNGGSR